MTTKPESTTTPSQIKMALEKRMWAYFCNNMATMSVPPVVACWRTTKPQPKPIMTAPMMEVSMRCSVMLMTPPQSFVGSRA